MIVSFRSWRLLALALLTLFAGTAIATAECKDILEAFNQALERRVLPEVIRLEGTIIGDAACGDRLVEVQRRRAALQLLVAQQLIEKGSAIADYENYVFDADKPDVLWSAAKMLGDIRFRQRQ